MTSPLARKPRRPTVGAHHRAISELLESISDGFVAFDRDWHYLLVNSAASKLLRKAPEELLGKVFWDVFPETEQLRSGADCVEAVGSCAEALKAAHSHPPAEPFQALVCDLGLPDGSGLDVVRDVKAHTQGVAAVALSSYGTDDDIRQSKKAGFAKHLVKPASIQELRRALVCA